MNRQSEFMVFTIELARRVGKLLMKFHNQRLKPIWTSPTHFKTKADEDSNQLIRRAIISRFPEHNILSEESAPRRKKSLFTWVIDPVDGTINLRTGVTDHFSVCIAFCENKTPILGVINAPKRKEFYRAERNKGAFCNDLPIYVSETKDISPILMGVDSGKHDRAKHLPYLKKLLSPGGITCFLSTGCASVPLSLVARGTLDAYLATSLEPEDMAAAVVIIREAGGKVTNLQGKEWQLGDKSILATNPYLHKKLIKFLV
ncbi:MAG: hypothetical protein COU10_01420 [Candidatus Harrisonbacteria bacterium CG10_big_fil_rev_8_21_14_0_10_45_28]|uniref:Inositol monophosphatase n=1 Tax=Candidatus Harrisonbacteria bacterium CG10_big_fil_rev_8_21_14_0_10_45_28 TaxID=1974586 RepID=A0A2H0UNS1_9BACT|nr:MAG: hypothetical protein COU10_01420 [Candidatus Harrisonbacteria bacterium CG10_big_fil_rev_8_21_14_0_10_45_28]